MITKVVNPDGVDSVPSDFATIQLAYAFFEGLDLTSEVGGGEIVVYPKSGDYTGSYSINGGSWSSAHRTETRPLIIRPATGYEHDGISNTGVVIRPTSLVAGAAVTSSQPYIYWQDLEWDMSSADPLLNLTTEIAFKFSMTADANFAGAIFRFIRNHIYGFNAIGGAHGNMLLAGTASSACEAIFANNAIAEGDGLSGHWRVSIAANITVAWYNNTHVNINNSAGFNSIIRYDGGGGSFRSYNNIFDMRTNNAVFLTSKSPPDAGSNNARSGASGFDVTQKIDNVSQTFTYADDNPASSSMSLVLTTGDTGAKEKGLDLSADSFYAFANDIRRAGRPLDALWDIGCAEAGVLTYTITTTAGANGAVVPDGAVIVASGNNQIFNISPDTHYEILEILLDSTPQTIANPFTVTNVLANHTLEVNFSKIQYIVTVSTGAGGSAAPTGAVAVDSGDDLIVDITTLSGYEIDEILLDSISQTIADPFTISNVLANHTLEINFQLFYPVAVNANTGGTASPAGTTQVKSGADLVITITPDADKQIFSILLDGIAQSVSNPFTVENVVSTHAVEIFFEFVSMSNSLEISIPNSTLGVGAYARPSVYLASTGHEAFRSLTSDAVLTVTGGIGYLIDSPIGFKLFVATQIGSGRIYATLMVEGVELQAYIDVSVVADYDWGLTDV